MISAPAKAGELVGPGRFCGYSPIIDLLPGEKVTTLEGGIHGGSFRWEGAFGSLEVHGIGWASRPKGRMIKAATGTRPARFAQRRQQGRCETATGTAHTVLPTSRLRSRSPICSWTQSGEWFCSRKGRHRPAVIYELFSPGADESYGRIGSTSS